MLTREQVDTVIPGNDGGRDDTTESGLIEDVDTTLCHYLHAEDSNIQYHGYLPGEFDIYPAEMDPASGRVISRPGKLDPAFGRHNDDPSYSPDGRRLAYVSNSGVRHIIFNNVFGIHDFSSGKDGALDPNLMSFLEPRWSSDGQAISTMCGEKLAFIQRPGDSTGDTIFCLPATGGESKALVKNRSIRFVEWSPDRKFIDFCAWNHADNRLELMRVTADGGEIQKRGPDIPITQRRSHFPFSICPDGRQIAFVSAGEK